MATRERYSSLHEAEKAAINTINRNRRVHTLTLERKRLAEDAKLRTKAVNDALDRVRDTAAEHQEAVAELARLMGQDQ